LATLSSYERQVLDVIRECDLGIEQLSVCARAAPSLQRQLCKRAITGMIIKRESLKRGLIRPEEAAGQCSRRVASITEEKADRTNGELVDM
jgi:hypothetical protein